MGLDRHVTTRPVRPALAVALNDEEPLVRGHAAWALVCIATEAARQALAGRVEMEEDAWVREEIGAAVGSRSPSSYTAVRRA